MKAKTTIIISLTLIVLYFVTSASSQQAKGVHQPIGNTLPAFYDTLKSEAFTILDAKCNQCHRKQNPFMLFKPKNMEKRVSKIYQMVFVERRMPKGNTVKLTTGEYNTLRSWISTINSNISWK